MASSRDRDNRFILWARDVVWLNVVAVALLVAALVLAVLVSLGLLVLAVLGIFFSCCRRTCSTAALVLVIMDSAR